MHRGSDRALLSSNDFRLTARFHCWLCIVLPVQRGALDAYRCQAGHEDTIFGFQQPTEVGEQEFYYLQCSYP